MHRILSFNTFLFMHILVCVCVHMHICIHTATYIHIEFWAKLCWKWRCCVPQLVPKSQDRRAQRNVCTFDYSWWIIDVRNFHISVLFLDQIHFHCLAALSALPIHCFCLQTRAERFLIKKKIVRKRLLTAIFKSARDRFSQSDKFWGIHLILIRFQSLIWHFEHINIR